MSDEPLKPHVWMAVLGRVLLAIFCFELGLILLIYPWTGWWMQNYFASQLRDIWSNGYLRGAVSGLGVVNVWIAVSEVFRMFHRS